MESARILIEVVAGVIPNAPMPEYTKKFAISSDAWYAQGKYEGKPEEAKIEVLTAYGLATEYMRSLMNPRSVNWVRLDCIYL
jgi:hypothetical protein